MVKQEYFVDFYKDKYGEREVKVEALYDKNGEELYNGAKAILDVPWGDGKEIGKVVISKFITDEYDDYGYNFGEFVRRCIIPEKEIQKKAKKRKNPLDKRNMLCYNAKAV